VDFQYEVVHYFSIVLWHLLMSNDYRMVGYLYCCIDPNEHKIKISGGSRTTVIGSMRNNCTVHAHLLLSFCLLIYQFLNFTGCDVVVYRGNRKSIVEWQKSLTYSIII